MLKKNLIYCLIYMLMWFVP